jgi:hypothetical protein
MEIFTKNVERQQVDGRDCASVAKKENGPNSEMTKMPGENTVTIETLPRGYRRLAKHGYNFDGDQPGCLTTDY